MAHHLVAINMPKRSSPSQGGVAQEGAFAHLNPTDKWVLVIPVENLQLSKRRLKIGRVVFFKFTKIHLARYARITKNILAPNVHYTREQKRQHVKLVRERILEPLLNKTCAETHLSGHLEDVTQETLNVVDAALNVMKLYRYINDDFYSRYFGIAGTVVPIVRRDMLRVNVSETHFDPTSSMVGHLFPFEIDNERLQFMRKNGLKQIASLVGKSSRNSLENRIVAAIHWFAKAFDVAIGDYLRSRPIELPVEKITMKGTKSDSITFFDRLVKLMICAETLFLFGRDEPIRTSISERSALLLGRTYRERREIKRFFGTMYDKRSDIVHGRKAQLTEDELTHLTYYLQVAIITLVKRLKRLKLSSDDDLREWFEKSKLGG